MSGKGSAPRPKSVPEDIYSANWGVIDWSARDKALTEAEQEESATPELTE